MLQVPATDAYRRGGSARLAGMLTDRFGRQIDYIRLSVTDRCDFRCVYCMAEEMTFVPRAEILSLEELARVARAFVDLGVKRVRLTGGEPTIRPGLAQLAQWISAAPGLKELNLTTNGAHLTEQAMALRAAGVQRLNISLDSLDPQRFRAMARPHCPAPAPAASALPDAREFPTRIRTAPPGHARRSPPTAFPR